MGPGDRVPPRLAGAGRDEEPAWEDEQDERADRLMPLSSSSRRETERDEARGRDDGEQRSGEVAVAREPTPDNPDDEYQWHTGIRRPTGRPDAVEFVETHKAFGRNKILRGLNMGLPEGMISMILGPSGTGKSVCIKHMVGLLYPDDGDVLARCQPLSAPASG
ncbi:unannotated protein [freshwater metagenome]|uniref:Unannotated protein n=1 Tax=freshwater metagenome TaxID=449393 RepID=A0A6J7HX93_9ZZZZ